MPKFGENMTKEKSIAGQRRHNKKQQQFLNNYVHKAKTQKQAESEEGYRTPTHDAER